jgi:hypothetical protein
LVIALAGVCRAADRVIALKPAGRVLAARIDTLDIAHRWLRGTERVAWRTGEPLLKEHGVVLAPLQKDETHCSSFAAAAAELAGVYLLHPPEHSHVLLANAQFEWLPSKAGRHKGWRPVTGPVGAQGLANDGELVVAVFKNPDIAMPGHIAIIRPFEKSEADIEARGPQITQAGFNNYVSADLQDGFDHHPGAWLPDGRGAVRFYAHKVDPKEFALGGTP